MPEPICTSSVLGRAASMKPWDRPLGICNRQCAEGKTQRPGVRKGVGFVATGLNEVMP